MMDQYGWHAIRSGSGVYMDDRPSGISTASDGEVLTISATTEHTWSVLVI